MIRRTLFARAISPEKEFSRTNIIRVVCRYERPRAMRISENIQSTPLRRRMTHPLSLPAGIASTEDARALD
jgi:hypothetical protein